MNTFYLEREEDNKVVRAQGRYNVDKIYKYYSNTWKQQYSKNE